ncbi:IclR family pca regulon transcriptional regulator [Streptomyces griseochromogenes]|uniref:IclR family pca regulon transcriptional regulator n=1 Tax=Streptomyces griseochromogenes TaxID=68214 RepID=A0A1B1BA78_9ACTN|nr:IclR family transcriptional regulator C-terminal domain-containing protein [Streptomyces griseochromogenes]ANP55632.1 IclR family transcriptional regulator [Streptomyces griseochromogenes]MBP2052751.1 IclR family pca regulon transcriptional regulator [Streptomyces griseochromogenes]
MPANTAQHDVAGGPPAEAVAPLIRGIAVLRRLTEAGGTLSPSALERATGLARSTVDRITATLARMGHVRLDGRDVVLTPRVMELGNAYLAALRLPALLDARADALADELDESVSLAVADLDGIRFIHQATRRRAMSVSFRIGDLLPAERTAPGPLFAAEWTEADWQRWRSRRASDPEDTAFPAVPPRPPSAADDFDQRTAQARRNGWALDDQLIEPGLVAVSVPVREPGTGRTACVASVVSHTSRHTASGLRTALLPRLRTAVAAMEADLREAATPRPGPPLSGLATWTTASKHELGREFVESLARGLTVLTAFGEGRSALTLAEVARATGLARATARRALITYEYLGLVTTVADHRTFTLTPRVLDLGFPPLSRTTLPRLAEPHLRALADQLHEPTALAVLAPGTGRAADAEIQYTAGASTSRVLTVEIAVGARLPASSTSLGRVLLADAARPLSPALAEVRAQGYALVDQELESGLRSLAVPVRDRAGRVIAALNVATHPARRTLEECVHDLLPTLHTTADRIQTDLHTASRFTRVPPA